MSNGYTQSELDGIQAKWNLRFPPDLLKILRGRRRVIDQGDKFRSFDWLEVSDDVIRDSLNWPFEGFLFDVENNDLWRPEWGKRPADKAEREERLRSILADAPKLIPVYGHRYIPEEPHESGNPIFSVWQADIIYYGADLEDYVAREMRTPDLQREMKPPKTIRFWTRVVELNNQRFQSGGSFRFYHKGSVLPDNGG
jgi:hypothetical protein